MIRITSFLKPYRPAMAIALFLMLVELAVELLQPVLIAKIIDDGIMQKDLSVIYYWGSIMIAFSLAAFIAGITNSFFASHASQGFAYDTRKALFEKIQAFSFSNLGKFESSSLITRLTTDVTQVQNTVFMSLRIALRAPLLIIGGLVMSLFVHLQLGLLLTITTPLLAFFLIWIMKKGGALFKSVQVKLDGVNSVMQENLSGMRLIKTLLRKDYEVDRFTKANHELKSRTVTGLRMLELTMPILFLIMNAGIMAVLWFGHVEVTNGGTDVGAVVAIVNYATRMTNAFSVLSWIIMALSRARASSQRITEVLNTDIDLADTDGLEANAEIRGDITFSNVSFSYPEEGTEILNNISFSVKAGERLAILGATGSGKSSLFNLIPRLYDTVSGAIFIDGKNVTEYKLEELRKQIGFVPQEAMLFTGTIKENIGWGKENTSIEEIEEAARNAQIHETILKLPLGYETKIGQKGVNLSGGQKQRISIARALVRKPKILMLDDSTSALDLKTEARLLEAIKNYDCTTLIITQKISTARQCDKILLLDEAAVSGIGTHEELTESNSLYKEIVHSQLGKEETQNVKAAY